MKRIIILNGVATSGKDSLADFIIQRANETDDTYAYKMSTVDKVKEISKHFGVEDAKTDSERRLWSDLKDAWTRYNNGPFNDIVERISYLYNGKNSNSIYIIMCREPDEIAKFKERYGTTCIATIVHRKDLEVPDNHADQNVDNYDYDCMVYNYSSLRHLQAIGENICDTIFDNELTCND